MISQRRFALALLSISAPEDDARAVAPRADAAPVHVQLADEARDSRQHREVGRHRATASRIEVEDPEVFERGVRADVQAHIRMLEGAEIEGVRVVRAEITSSLIAVLAAHTHHRRLRGRHAESQCTGDDGASKPVLDAHG